MIKESLEGCRCEHWELCICGCSELPPVDCEASLPFIPGAMLMIAGCATAAEIEVLQGGDRPFNSMGLIKYVKVEDDR